MDVKVATLAQVPPGCVREVSYRDKKYALYNVDGAIYASSARCPHAGAPLAQGFLENGEITCPFHMWGFDVRTGECLTDPDWSPLETVAARVEDGAVYLTLDE